MENRMYALRGALKRVLRKIQGQFKQPVIVLHPGANHYRELGRTGKFSNVLVNNTHRTLFMLLVIGMLASACTPAAGTSDVDLPNTGQTQAAGGEVGSGNSSTGRGPIPAVTPPPAVLEAVRFLGDSLGINTNDILILDFTQVDWQDACLGLPKEGEVCAQVITPGYRVILEVNGQKFELHTDTQGVSIRQQ